MCANEDVLGSPVKTPRSPWRRLFREPLKPKLSRKVIRNARVNLNKYWSKFEELASARAPLTTIASSRTVFSNENYINENLANEFNERCK